MASTRQRGETFTGLYRDLAGKQKSAGSFKTKKAAQAAAERAEALVKAGVDPASRAAPTPTYAAERRGRVTVAGYAPKWLAGHPLEPASREAYESMTKHLIRHLGERAVAEVEPAHVRAMLRAIEKTHSAGTAGLLRTVTLMMFRSAVTDKLRDDNPAENVKAARRHRRQMMIATPAQARAIEAAAPERYRLLIRTMFATGARWSELVGLRGTDVEQRGSGYVLCIRRTAVEVGGKVNVRDYGKSGTAIRDITIPADLARGIMERGTDLCFASLRGGYLHRSTFRNRVWVPACKAAGVPGLRVHDARHSHASWLANRPEIPLVAVRDRLGHSSLSVTSRYAHLVPGDDDPVLRALEVA